MRSTSWALIWFDHESYSCVISLRPTLVYTPLCMTLSWVCIDIQHSELMTDLLKEVDHIFSEKISSTAVSPLLLQPLNYLSNTNQTKVFQLRVHYSLKVTIEFHHFCSLLFFFFFFFWISSRPHTSVAALLI